MLKIVRHSHADLELAGGDAEVARQHVSAFRKPLHKSVSVAQTCGANPWRTAKSGLGRASVECVGSPIVMRPQKRRRGHAPRI